MTHKEILLLTFNCYISYIFKKYIACPSNMIFVDITANFLFIVVI